MKRFLSMLMAVAMIIALIPALATAEDVTGSDVTGSDMEIIATHYYGDTNFDDLLTTYDAAEMLRMCADIIKPTEEQTALTYDEKMKIDANIDGNFNTIDASFVLKVAADMKTANMYFEYSTQPTTQPTTEPTTEPTAEPTAEPTPTPAQFDTYVTVSCFDCFNDIQVASIQVGVNEGRNVITAENIELPEDECSYVLEDENFQTLITVTNGAATPSSLKVNVIPVVSDDDGNIYKVIFNMTGFNRVDNDLKANYILATNIDCGGAKRVPFGWNGTNANQEPRIFEGIFDGNGYYVLDFLMDYTAVYDSDGASVYSYAGLFSMNTGTIRNLGVLGQVLSDAAVGVLVGGNGGRIEDCYVYGYAGSMDVCDTNYQQSMARGACGGICGENYGVITRCCFEGSIEGFYWIGGLVGRNIGGRISECYFAGDINMNMDDELIEYYSARYIGGLCGGCAEGAQVTDCYAYHKGGVVGDKGVGGLFGWVSGGTLTNCFVVNAMEYASEYVDDLAGYVASAPQYSGLCASDDENLPMPQGYSPEIWDMGGAQPHTQFPDLINNRRPEGGFYVD